MLILFGAWRIDHASNVSRARQREADIAAEILRTFVDRMPRADMVGSAGLNENRDLDIAHVHRLAEHFELAARELVLVIELAQIGLMGRARNVCLVGIPIEEVERPGLFAHHVIVDDIAPNQIGRAEPVKRLAHHLTRHNAIMLIDHFIDLLKAFFAGEDFKLAREIKI